MQDQAPCELFKDAYSGKCVYRNVELAPKFGKSRSDLVRYIRGHFNPEEYSPYQGAYSIKCIVDSSGIVSFVRVSNKNDKNLSSGEKALVEIVSKMPSWTPGQCKGKKVDCIATISISF